MVAALYKAILIACNAKYATRNNGMCVEHLVHDVSAAERYFGTTLPTGGDLWLSHTAADAINLELEKSSSRFTLVRFAPEKPSSYCQGDPAYREIGLVLSHKLLTEYLALMSARKTQAAAVGNLIPCIG